MWLTYEFSFNNKLTLSSFSPCAGSVFLPPCCNIAGGTVGYPALPGLICLSVCLSVRGWVRAKRGIWSKRVFMRTNGNFSFSVRWRNDTIIHKFLLAKKVLNIFEKQSWLYGCRSIQLSPTGLTPRRNWKAWLAGQPIQICEQKSC